MGQRNEYLMRMVVAANSYYYAIIDEFERTLRFSGELSADRLMFVPAASANMEMIHNYYMTNHIDGKPSPLATVLNHHYSYIARNAPLLYVYLTSNHTVDFDNKYEKSTAAYLLHDIHSDAAIAQQKSTCACCCAKPTCENQSPQPTIYKVITDSLLEQFTRLSTRHATDRLNEYTAYVNAVHVVAPTWSADSELDHAQLLRFQTIHKFVHRIWPTETRLVLNLLGVFEPVHGNHASAN